MSILHLDFETRSAADLTKTGADVYARHPSTTVLCTAYCFDDEPIEILVDFQPVPKRIMDHIEKGFQVCAHNAHFELLIWNYTLRRFFKDLPELKIEQMLCTMAMAYAMALPGKLEKAAPALGIEDRKGMQGQRIMLQLSKPKEILPNGEIEWYRDSEKFKRLYEYCKQDVEVERQLFKRLMSLSPSETKVWHLDWKINQRGILIDLAAVKIAIKIVEAEKDRLDREMREVTGNQVATCSAVKQLTDFLISRGVKIESVAKADVLALLNTPLPDDCKKALLLRQEAAKSSTAKLEAMALGADTDGRIRSTLQYHGAGPGRWAGRRLQVHNLPRPKLKQKEIEGIFDLLRRIE